MYYISEAHKLILHFHTLRGSSSSNIINIKNRLAELCPQITDLTSLSGLKRELASENRLNNLLIEDEHCLPAVFPEQVENVCLLDCDFSSIQMHTSKIKNFFIIGNKQGCYIHDSSIMNFRQGILDKIFGDDKWTRIERNCEFRLHSRNIGMFFDKVNIDGEVIFLNTDLSGMHSEECLINAPLIFDSTILDNAFIANYQISGNASLNVISSLTKNKMTIDNLTFYSSLEPSEAGVVFHNINFQNSFFSCLNRKTFLAISTLSDTEFNNCDFTSTEISYLDCKDSDWCFNDCVLCNTEYKGLKGLVNIREGNVRIKVQDCNIQLSIKNRKETVVLDFENSVIRNPQWEFDCISNHFWGGELLVESGHVALLKNCKFQGVDFSKMTFTVLGEIDLTNTVFESCNLSGISFDNCIINNTAFYNCNLTDSIFNANNNTASDLTISGDKTKLFGARISGEFKNLRLDCISSEEISATKFEQCILKDAVFKNMDFKKWDVAKLVFMGGTLENCSFNKCNLQDVEFRSENEFPVKLVNCSFEKQKEFNGTIFLSISLWDTSFRGVCFEKCWIACDSFWDTHYAAFADTRWVECEFQPGLDLSNFPFTDIAMMQKIAFSEIRFGETIIDCTMINVQFENCLAEELVFGSNTRNSYFESIDIKQLLPEVSGVSRLIFNYANLDTVSVSSVEDDSLGFLLSFKNNTSLKNITLHNLSLTKLNFICNKNISSLIVNNVRVKSGTFNDCNFVDSEFSIDTVDLNEEEFTIKSCLFDDGCKFDTCSWGNFHGSNTNILSLPVSCYRGFKITGSRFDNSNISCDFAGITSQNKLFVKLCLDDIYFDKCSFNGAVLNGFSFPKCEFTETCDFSGVEHSSIENADFSNSIIAANIDGLKFKECILKGTLFSSDYTDRKHVEDVSFTACVFNSDTTFRNIEFTSNNSSVVFFDKCESLEISKIENCKFINYSFPEIKFIQDINIVFNNCQIDRLELECNGSLQVKIEGDTFISVCQFTNLTADRGAIKVFDSIIENITFIDCTLNYLNVKKTAFRNLIFKECAQLKNITFKGCSFMEPISFISEAVISADPAEPPRFLIENVKFTGCYFHLFCADDANPELLFKLMGNYHSSLNHKSIKIENYHLPDGQPFSSDLEDCLDDFVEFFESSNSKGEFRLPFLRQDLTKKEYFTNS